VPCHDCRVADVDDTIEVTRTIAAGNGLAGMNQEEEREPDYRFSLANERTLLAYLRTALALMAAGVALSEFADQPVVRTLGDALTVTGIVVSGASYYRWRAIQRALRRSEPLPRPLIPLLIAIVLGAAAVVFLVAR
jgi:putative membrane protein